MTEAVDLDRLADYIGGALDGTPEAGAVARLIADDPRWASAADALGRADSLVRADLSVLAAAPEPMPAEVAARIDATLAAAPPALALLDGGRAGERTPGSLDRRRRMRRWTAAAAVAAGVVALGLGVVSALPNAGLDNNKTAPFNGLNRPEGAEPAGPGNAATPSAALPPGLGAASGARVVASGNDYRRGDLGALARQPGLSAAAPGAGQGSAPEPHSNDARKDSSDTAVPDELSRLRDAVALKSCVDAIQGEYGGTVTVVDFARFEGRPAVVVLLAGANGRSGLWAVVVGPGCGLGGGIADELYNGPV